MIHPYAFSDKLKLSQGVAQRASVIDVLMANVPGATRIERSGELGDRNGTDYWVYRACGRALSVDAKVRDEDWKPRGKDDLALETWSVIERQKIGWTRDTSKQTDYILWLWKDTGRWCLVPFVMLCGVFRTKADEWSRQYQVSRQFTPDRGYHSECVFVPRLVVWRAIYKAYGGVM